MRKRIPLLLALATVAVAGTLYGATRRGDPSDARPITVARAEAALAQRSGGHEGGGTAPSDPSGAAVSCQAVERDLARTSNAQGLALMKELDAAGLGYTVGVAEMYGLSITMTPAQSKAAEPVWFTTEAGKQLLKDVDRGLYPPGFDVRSSSPFEESWDTVTTADEETLTSHQRRLQSIAEAMGEAGVHFTTEMHGPIEMINGADLHRPEVLEVLEDLHTAEACDPQPLDLGTGEMVEGSAGSGSGS